MSNQDLPEELARFIYEYIDSAEIVDVLLILKSRHDNFLSAKMISDELRANPESVSKRLFSLKVLDLIQEDPNNSELYCYCPGTPRLSALMDVLSESYKVRRQRVLAAIFSPAKKMRDFADAFVVRNRKKEDADG
jgi:hypothetical protein